MSLSYESRLVMCLSYEYRPVISSSYVSQPIMSSSYESQPVMGLSHASRLVMSSSYMSWSIGTQVTHLVGSMPELLESCVLSKHGPNYESLPDKRLAVVDKGNEGKPLGSKGVYDKGTHTPSEAADLTRESTKPYLRPLFKEWGTPLWGGREW